MGAGSLRWSEALLFVQARGMLPGLVGEKTAAGGALLPLRGWPKGDRVLLHLTATRSEISCKTSSGSASLHEGIRYLRGLTYLVVCRRMAFL